MSVMFIDQKFPFSDVHVLILRLNGTVGELNGGQEPSSSANSENTLTQSTNLCRPRCLEQVLRIANTSLTCRAQFCVPLMELKIPRRN